MHERSSEIMECSLDNAEADVATTIRSSHRGCSVRKGVLKNFAKFSGKHLCQSLFFNKVAGLRTPGDCFVNGFHIRQLRVFNGNTD